MKSFDLRLGLCVLGLALGATLAWHLAAPRTYVASARVMLEKGGAESRIVKLESAAPDPAAARSHLSHLLANYSGASVLDAPAIAPARQSLALELAIGGGLGLALGGGLTFWQARRRRPVRKERELLPLLGNPLLAARPLQPEALRALARQLCDHWFTSGARYCRSSVPGRATDAAASPCNSPSSSRRWASARCWWMEIFARLRYIAPSG